MCICKWLLGKTKSSYHSATLDCRLVNWNNTLGVVHVGVLEGREGSFVG